MAEIESEKYGKIDRLIQKYAQTGERAELDQVSLEDLVRAQAHNHANHFHGWFKKYEELIGERKEALRRNAEIHKHYRGIAIGYTATVVTLSLVGLKYIENIWKDIDGPVMKGINLGDITKVALIGPFLFSILLCVLSQFLIFRGYLKEARGHLEIANKKYFGPTDKIVRLTLYLFLIGTAFVLISLLKWWSLALIWPFIWFCWHYYRGSF